MVWGTWAQFTDPQISGRDVSTWLLCSLGDCFLLLFPQLQSIFRLVFSLFLSVVLPAIGQTALLSCFPTLLQQPLPGKIPSSFLTINYFQTSSLYIFFSLLPVLIYTAFIAATVYYSFRLSSFVKCYIWDNWLSCSLSCFIFLCFQECDWFHGLVERLHLMEKFNSTTKIHLLSKISVEKYRSLSLPPSPFLFGGIENDIFS